MRVAGVVDTLDAGVESSSLDNVAIVTLYWASSVTADVKADVAADVAADVTDMLNCSQPLTDRVARSEWLAHSSFIDKPKLSHNNWPELETVWNRKKRNWMVSYEAFKPKTFVKKLQ